MEVYYFNHDLLPNDGKLTVDSIFKRTKLFKDSREYKRWVEKGFISIRGGKTIESPTEAIRVEDDMVFLSRFKGGVRFRFRESFDI